MGDELDLAPPIQVICEFITSQMDRFTEATKETQFTKAWEPLDIMFRRTLVRVNGDKIEQDDAGQRP